MSEKRRRRALYAGLAGPGMVPDRFEIGAGIVLRKTYMHVMAPYVAAFRPAEPGQPHPGPWKTVSGGLSFDVALELSVPPDLDPPKPFDAAGILWFLVALLRLRATPLLRVPVIASHPFIEIPELPFEPRFWPIEMEPQHSCPIPDPSTVLSAADLEWVRDHWRQAAAVYNASEDYQIAIAAADRVIWTSSPPLALVALWGALERVFSRDKAELRFRVAANIAAYLEPPGISRLALFKVVRSLYDRRSEAAHGSGSGGDTSITETYGLLRRAIFRMIEEEHVPSREDLEACLFGAYGSA